MNTAFYVVFTLFVVALAGLAFTAVRWAVRRDRLARAEQTAAAGTEPGSAPADPSPPGPVTRP